MIDQTALERCNRLFRSRQHSLLADHIVADLQLPRSAPRVSDDMNAVTDTALSLCGHGFYARAWCKLGHLLRQKRGVSCDCGSDLPLSAGLSTGGRHPRRGLCGCGQSAAAGSPSVSRA